MAICARSSSGSSIAKFMVAACMAGLIIMGFRCLLAVPNSHAIERHGADAIAAGECMNNPANIIASFFNPDTCRYATVGRVNDSTYVEFTESNGDSVTALKVSKALEKIYRWLTNVGYTTLP